MRILGKVLAGIAAALLVLQAVCVFLGYPMIYGAVGGIELITLAAWCITDAIVNFEKPKRQFVRYTFSYDDGTSEKHIVANDAPYELNTSSNKALETISIEYFESDKDEVSKNE